MRERRSPLRYSEAELAFLEARKTMPRREVHAEFTAAYGRDDVDLQNLRALMKRKGWMTGRDGTFAKGTPPSNKGKKLPYNAARAATQFKKGHVPHTARGLGHESADPKQGYVCIIVAESNPHTGAPTRRVMKHKWLWEQKHGPVPEGMALKCLDADRTNTAPSNWELIPKGMLPRLNGRRRRYDVAPEELRPTIMAVAKLEHAVAARKERPREASREEA